MPDPGSSLLFLILDACLMHMMHTCCGNLWQSVISAVLHASLMYIPFRMLSLSYWPWENVWRELWQQYLQVRQLFQCLQTLHLMEFIESRLLSGNYWIAFDDFIWNCNDSSDCKFITPRIPDSSSCCSVTKIMVMCLCYVVSPCYSVSLCYVTFAWVTWPEYQKSGPRGALDF